MRLWAPLGFLLALVLVLHGAVASGASASAVLPSAALPSGALHPDREDMAPSIYDCDDTSASTTRFSITRHSASRGYDDRSCPSPSRPNVSPERVAAKEEVALARYAEGGGHHVPAKSAFRDAVNYDAAEALAISNRELARLGVSHARITGAQQTLYRQFAASGDPLTWSAVAGIERRALVAAGMNGRVAGRTVNRAIDALRQAGVPGPTRIPWGG